jgi:hypothetical protein
MIAKQKSAQAKEAKAAAKGMYSAFPFAFVFVPLPFHISFSTFMVHSYSLQSLGGHF